MAAAERSQKAARGGADARLRELAERALAALELDLVHLEYRKEGRSWVLRLYIERADSGVTLDDCARASEQFSALLDATDAVPHHFTLEVSSPGLDRPLVKEDDYRRFTGRRARLTTFKPLDGQRHFTGVIAGVEDGDIRIRLDDGQEKVLPFQLIASGRLEVELGHEVNP